MLSYFLDFLIAVIFYYGLQQVSAIFIASKNLE